MEDLTREQKRRGYHREYWRANRSAQALQAAAAQPDSTPDAAALADGFYQVENDVPYRIACNPGDSFHVDADGVL